MIRFKVNGQERTFDGDEEMPLLWYLRDDLKLKGTKFGCGIGSCGACTVHIDGSATRSCVTPMEAVDSVEVTTIEGISVNGLHPVQKAWLEIDVPQCGYCQVGQIMATIDFLKQYPNPKDADIDAAHDNLCRCGTYTRIRQAIHRAADLMKEEA